MLLGFLLNGRMPPKNSVSKVRKGCTTTEVSLPRVVPNMLSTRVKPSLPSLSNIFSATKMKPFSTPFARKSCDQSRHGGKVVKRSYISGSESESELDSVVGGKEASIEAEALAGVWKSFWCLGTYNLCLEICVNRDISSKCDIARKSPNLTKILKSA